MELRLETEPQKFLDQVSPTLGSEPAVHSFLLSLTTRYAGLQKSMALLATGVNASGEIVAAGVQTESDRALVISRFSESEAEQFAELLSHHVEFLPGVNGPVPAVDVFAMKWSSLKGIQAELCTNLRLFVLEALVNPRPTNGLARPALFSDRDILFNWLLAFRDEATPNDPRPSDEALYSTIDRGIEHEEFFLWEDHEKIVCLVVSSRETKTERWIGPVYTPPEARGSGYGSALTAFVSGKILSSGKQAVLFTDLMNSTSNSIYQNIGYKPVADFKHYLFA